MSGALLTPSLRNRLAVLAILGVALIARLWTIGSGIPYAVGVDEPEIMRRAVAMMKSGDFNPHFFDYGGLTIYVHTAIASLRFAIGALSGQLGYGSLDRVWEGSFYLWARTATALLGTLTVYIVYRVALRWGTRAALLASLAAAVHPNLVREAHFALTDTPLAFFVALTLLLTMIAAEDGRLRWFALAGLTAGLATATKYNGAVALLMPLTVAALGRTVRLRAAAAVAAATAAAAAFLAGAPYSLLDLPAFLKAFAQLAQSYNRPRPATEIAELYLTYLRNSFSFGWGGWWNLLGWGATLVAVAGLIGLAVRPPARAGRAAAAAVLVFGVAYFWLIAHQSLVYARYALPLVPVLCLGLGVGMSAAADAVQSRARSARTRRLVVPLVLLLLVPPAWQAAAFNRDRSKVGTEEVAARWLEANISPEDSILIETPVIVLPPRFRWDYTHRLIHEPLEAYRARGVKYLVASSERIDVAERQGGSDAAAYRQLMAATQVVHMVPRSQEHPGPTLTILRVPDR